MPRIVAEKLRKSFRIGGSGFFRRTHRTVHALDGVGFTIEPGEMVGTIGPNGAGKSTTIKILAGILVPDSGTCTVGGRVPWKERTAHVARIGVVFGQRSQLWWDLPVRDSFTLLRDIYAVSEPDFRRRRDELVDRLNLNALVDVPVRQMSLGQRMRCEIAASLLHGPELLFLDEPTIGLDADSKLAVREFVRTLHRERGATVILTTHDMHDIEALCERVLLIAEGRVLADGSLDTLRRAVMHERWLIVESDELVDDEETETISREGDRHTLRFDPEKTPAAVLIGRIAARYAIRDLTVQSPPIEQVIARYYPQPLRESAS